MPKLADGLLLFFISFGLRGSRLGESDRDYGRTLPRHGRSCRGAFYWLLWLFLQFSRRIFFHRRQSLRQQFGGTFTSATGAVTVIVDNVNGTGVAPTGQVTVQVGMTSNGGAPPPDFFSGILAIGLAICVGLIILVVVVLALIIYLVTRQRSPPLPPPGPPYTPPPQQPWPPQQPPGQYPPGNP